MLRKANALYFFIGVFNAIKWVNPYFIGYFLPERHQEQYHSTYLEIKIYPI